MQYKGKLYGKLGNKYFYLEKTANDYDNLEEQTKALTEQLAAKEKELSEVKSLADSLYSDLKYCIDCDYISKEIVESVSKYESFNTPK